MIWLKFHKNFFNFELDVYICWIYISPNSLSYMKRNDVDKNIYDKGGGGFQICPPTDFLLTLHVWYLGPSNYKNIFIYFKQVV